MDFSVMCVQLNRMTRFKSVQLSSKAITLFSDVLHQLKSIDSQD